MNEHRMRIPTPDEAKRMRCTVDRTIDRFRERRARDRHRKDGSEALVLLQDERDKNDRRWRVTLVLGVVAVALSALAGVHVHL